jgi:hypothetical protein
MVDAQFTDSASYRLNIPCVPKRQTIEARRYQPAYPIVLEPYAPSPKRLGLPEFDPPNSVVYKLPQLSGSFLSGLEFPNA